MRAQEEEAPWAESIIHRCTSQEEKGEEEMRLPWYMKMSPERRDFDPVETINSSLQWLPEGPRGPSGRRRGVPYNQEDKEQFTLYLSS